MDAWMIFTRAGVFLVMERIGVGLVGVAVVAVGAVAVRSLCGDGLVATQAEECGADLGGLGEADGGEAQENCQKMAEETAAHRDFTTGVGAGFQARFRGVALRVAVEGDRTWEENRAGDVGRACFGTEVSCLWNGCFLQGRFCGVGA